MASPSSYNGNLDDYKLIRRLKELEISGDDAQWWLVTLKRRPGREFLLKKYRTSLSTTEKESFLENAWRLRQFSHSQEAVPIKDQIPQVQDLGVKDDGTAFIVLENKLDTLGKTLREKHRGKPVPLAEVREYVQQTCAVLSVAHAQGISCLNLAPHYVRVRDDGRLLLLDFKLLNLTNYSLSVSGYLAPEQLGNDLSAVGPLADQYGLTMLIRTLLTGSEPPQRRPVNLHKRPSFDGILAALVPVLEKATETNPGDRYQNDEIPIGPAEHHPNMTVFLMVQAIITFYRDFNDACTLSLAATANPASNPVNRLERPLPQPLLPDTSNANPASKPVSRIERLFSRIERLFRTRMRRRSVVIGISAVVASLLGGWGAVEYIEHHIPAYTFSGHHAAVMHIVVLPDGRVVSSDANGRVFLWSIQEQGKPLPLPGNEGKEIVGLACLSQDGNTYIAVLDVTGYLCIWNTSGDLEISGPLSGVPSALAWSQLVIHGQTHDHLLVAMDQLVKVYDSILKGFGDSDSPYKGHQGRVTGIAFFPDRQTDLAASASIDGTIHIWETETATRKGEPIDPYGPEDRQPITCVCWGSDGRSLAFGIGDGAVQVWDGEGNLKFSYSGHQAPVNSIAISQNGKLFASGGDDQTVQIWESDNGKNVYTYEGHTDSVNQVVWVGNNYVLSASSDTTVKVWLLRSG
jgi:serine/threonine protein kinase